MLILHFSFETQVEKAILVISTEVCLKVYDYCHYQMAFLTHVARASLNHSTASLFLTMDRRCTRMLLKPPLAYVGHFVSQAHTESLGTIRDQSTPDH